MLVSLNKIKSYVGGITVDTDELIKLIGSRLVEVEGYEDLGQKYQGIKIIKVAECTPIEGTHLHLCQIDAGTPELVQVVCGAPNVHAGMLTAWIMPGSIVPETYGNENFKLSVKKLRGYESNGMLAAADELALGSSHDGIIEIDPYMKIADPSEPNGSRPVRPGDDFATAFDLNDIILDIENKSLTHRPDCFGLIGFAREVAGILGLKFAEPNPAPAIETLSAANSASLQASVDNKSRNDGREEEKFAKLSVSIADPTLCPRYSCAILDCTKLLEKSKYFTFDDAFLAKLGMRGISPIVDLTNILMLETGQPLHAFDYDKFVADGGAKDPQIIVRLARPGEKLQLLDGKTIDCAEHDILITSNDTPVALAGAMGGASTEIDASSTKIILESATFSLYNLRKTQMAHGIFSEAITRFTKGQPASQTLPVLEEAVSRLAVNPIAVTDCYPSPVKPVVVKITTEEINQLLGTSYDAKTIARTLENVGFAVAASGDNFEITSPLWRTDIHIKEDIIEEVGRLLGFDNIPVSLPTRSFASVAPDGLWQLKSTLRSLLSDRLGAHEFLTYSFVSGDLLGKVGEPLADSYRIVNSISPELQYFRQSLLPSLLDKVYQNLRAGHKDFTIYEINQVASKPDGLDQDGVPILRTHLAVLSFGDYYRAKQIATEINQHLRISNPLTAPAKLPAYFEPARSAADGLGHFGEIKLSVLKKFKLDAYAISALEWDIEPILSLPIAPASFSGLTFSKFPIVARDLTFSTPASLSYESLSSALESALAAEGLIYQFTPTSIYQANAELDQRKISFHLDFAHPAKTLETAEISAIIDRITKQISALGAEAA